MNLSLIGPRGAGKSTLGRLLSRALGIEHFSIDAAVEERDGRPIARIVAESGWLQFRALEEAVLAEAVRRPGRLIDAGGGIVELPRNRKLLRDYGPVVWVQAPVAELIRRTADSAGRPPLSDLGDPAREMEETVFRRAPLYHQTADFSVFNAAAPEQAVCEEIVTWVRARQR